MVWNYQTADCSFRKKLYCVIYYNFRHTFVPMSSWGKQLGNSCSGMYSWKGKLKPGVKQRRIDCLWWNGFRIIYSRSLDTERQTGRRTDRRRRRATRRERYDMSIREPIDSGLANLSLINTSASSSTSQVASRWSGVFVSRTPVHSCTWWHCPQTMRSRVGLRNCRPSAVRPSVCRIRPPLLWVCCCGLGGLEISIDWGDWKRGTGKVRTGKHGTKAHGWKSQDWKTREHHVHG